MEHYISQLIEDLHKIALKVCTTDIIEEEYVNDDETFSKQISEIERYVQGDDIPLSSITGIEQEQLPPSEKLSEEQQKYLAIELEDFLVYFHFALEFPADYPYHLRYPFIRKLWNENYTLMHFGTIHIEFCNHDKENCPFPDY